MMREKLEKRFFYLFTGESFAIVGFVVIGYLLHLTYPELQLYSLSSFWASSFLLEFLLLQGTVYWYVKWKRLKKETILLYEFFAVRTLR